MVLQDRLKRQRAVDKMQLAKVEREKQQEMEQVGIFPVGIHGGGLSVCSPKAACRIWYVCVFVFSVGMHGDHSASRQANCSRQQQ